MRYWFILSIKDIRSHYLFHFSIVSKMKLPIMRYNDFRKNKQGWNKVWNQEYTSRTERTIFIKYDGIYIDKRETAGNLNSSNFYRYATQNPICALLLSSEKYRRYRNNWKSLVHFRFNGNYIINEKLCILCNFTLLQNFMNIFLVSNIIQTLYE